MGLAALPALPGPATETRGCHRGFTPPQSLAVAPSSRQRRRNCRSRAQGGAVDGRAGARWLSLHTVGARARQTNPTANFWAPERTWEGVTRVLWARVHGATIDVFLLNRMGSRGPEPVRCFPSSAVWLDTPEGGSGESCVGRAVWPNPPSPFWSL